VAPTIKIRISRSTCYTHIRVWVASVHVYCDETALQIGRSSGPHDGGHDPAEIRNQAASFDQLSYLSTVTDSIARYQPPQYVYPLRTVAMGLYVRGT
jgi:hypothetical protein